MRLSRELGIKAVRTWWPSGRDAVEDAVAAKRIERRAAADMGYAALPVAEDVSAPDMALAAAREAVDAAGVRPEEVGLLLHAWMYYQGHDLWSPPHYLANELGMTDAVPAGVQQVCNGGAMAIELAAARVTTDPGPGYALITTGDRFVDPGFDRWRSDYGIAYGDGGTALLLHRRDGSADELVLRSIATVSGAELEGLHRGRDGFSRSPHSISAEVSMRRTKKAYIIDHGVDDLMKVTRDRVVRVLHDCLNEADLAPDDPALRAVFLPRLGRKALTEGYTEAVAQVTSAVQLDQAANTGHLGPGDVAVSLTALARDNLLAPGEVALVLNAGAGFTWSCLAVQRPW
jgi:3-oxoacyl-[acyl-carrier-protein] synthase III